MRQGFTALALLALSISYCSAQDFAPRFDQLPLTAEGTRSDINSLCQDKLGYLWIATWNGLVRYDGYTTKMYQARMPGSAGLNGDKITSLHEDDKYQLWVGTNDAGLYRYDAPVDTFVHYPTRSNLEDGTSGKQIWAIQTDQYGYIWIGTNKGLDRYDQNNNKWLHFTHDLADNKSLSSDFIYSITETLSGELYVGCEVGLNKLVRNEANDPVDFMRADLTPDNVKPEVYLSHNFIQVLSPSQHNHNAVWVGTSIGLKFVEEIDGKFEYFSILESEDGLSHPFVTDIIETPDGSHVWVATYNGLNYLNVAGEREAVFKADPERATALRGSVILSLLQDESQNYWIGTDQGVQRLRTQPTPFVQKSNWPQQAPSNYSVSAFAKATDREGFWIGTNGAGLSFLPCPAGIPKLEAIQHYPLSPQITPALAGFVSDIKVSNTGELWISTEGAGLIHLNQADIPLTGTTLRKLTQLTKENSLEDDYIMSLAFTKNGDLFFGYWDDGLGRIEANSELVEHYTTDDQGKLALPDFPIVDLLANLSDDCGLYIGTRGSGLHLIDCGKDGLVSLVESFTAESDATKRLLDNSINHVHGAANGDVWIATSLGIQVLDNTNTLTSVGDQFQYFPGSVESVISEHDQAAWVASQRGLVRVLQDGEGKAQAVVNYGWPESLEGNVFRYRAATKSSADQLLFGGVNGLSLVRPQYLLRDSLAPKILITDLKLFNESVKPGQLVNDQVVLARDIAYTDELSLNYLNSVVSLTFTGVHLAAPDKLQYAHQLVGIDRGWVFTNSEQRTAYYTNLPYGNFTFLVKAANADGVWSEVRSLDIEVTPPFWKTRLAYAFYAFLLLGGVIGLRRATKLRTELKYKLELEQLEREKLEEVNQLKLQFYTNISHELRSPLTLILGPLEQHIRDPSLTKSIHKSMTRMHRNAERLLTMINQLLDIRKSEAGLLKLKVAEGNFVVFVEEVVLAFKASAKQKNIKLTFSAATGSLRLWYDRDEAEKVFYNLLSNAVKYTPEGGKIKVTLSEKFTNERGLRGAILRVVDNGPGIPESQQDKVFDRFHQVQDGSGDEHRNPGTGIGLALAREVVKAHGGVIKSAARDDKKPGASFSVWWRDGFSHFTEDELIQDFRGSDDPIHYLDATWSAPLVAQEDTAKPSTKKYTILLVEDSEDIRSYLKEQLSIIYNVEEAADGEAGWEKAEKLVPDLVIADISMPKLNGIDLCGRIKSTLATSHIPVILLTARTSLLYRIDGLETGADDYVTKPFSMQLLESRIKNLIATREKLKAQFNNGIDLSPSGLQLNSLDEDLLVSIKSIVEANIENSDFTVEELASALHLSRMQLYRKMKSITGKTPTKVIRTMRLKRAAQLLQSGQYNVSDVTYMVGYNDLRSFRTQFQKEFGVSPSGYQSIDNDQRADS